MRAADGASGICVHSAGRTWAPKGTPREIIAKINAAVMDTLADPAVRKRFTDIGQEIFPRATQQTSDALRAHHKAEIEKW